MPFKEFSLPVRIQNVVTMNRDEMRDMITKLPIMMSPADSTQWEANCIATQKHYADCFEVISQLLPLVLPTADAVDPAEITWAFTVVQTRSLLTDEETISGFGTGHLIPLFDMLNHAPVSTCDYAPPPAIIGQSTRTILAIQADPDQLSVETGPDGAALLMRSGRSLGRLDDCFIVTTSRGGLRAGKEARFCYHNPLVLTSEGRMMFALTYGFDPATPA